MPEEKRRNLAETEAESSCYNQEKCLEEFSDDKGAFYNGSKNDDSDNDDENYYENYEQQQLPEDFSNNWNALVSPILLQELINNDFAVCRYCSGTPLLVEDVASSHVFGRIWNFASEKENCLSISLKVRPITPKRNRYLK